METSSFERSREAILGAVLRHVPFDGWSRRALGTATAEMGHPARDVDRFFPGGTVDAIELWNLLADRAMTEAVARDGASLKTGERIALGIRARLDSVADNREAVRLALAVLTRPQNAARGLRMFSRTIDQLWRASGDASTDFNFYTKRLLLAPIYSATLVFWIGDRSEGHAATWAFLHRRLEDQLRVGGALNAMQRRLSRLPDPFAILGRLSQRPPTRRRTRL